MRRNMNRKQRIKRQAQHSIQRAKQHYSVDLDLSDLRGIVNLIQAQEGTFVPSEKQRKDRSCWDITWNGVVLRVVYDKHHKSIVTVLPTPEPEVVVPVD